VLGGSRIEACRGHAVTTATCNHGVDHAVTVPTIPSPDPRPTVPGIGKLSDGIICNLGDGQQMITDAGQAGPMSVLRDQLRDLSHKAATAAGMCNANQVLVDRGWVVSHVC
jgi:hypothetical protein